MLKAPDKDEILGPGILESVMKDCFPFCIAMSFMKAEPPSLGGC